MFFPFRWHTFVQQHNILGFRSGSTGCFLFLFFLCLTLDSPWFLKMLLPMCNFKSCRQLVILPGSEASVAKVPGNSNLDANCKQSASWMGTNHIIHHTSLKVVASSAEFMWIIHDTSGSTLGRKWAPKRKNGH